MSDNTSSRLLSSIIPIVRLGSVPISPKLARNPNIIRDANFGGLGVIRGTVKESGMPDHGVSRRVRLHRKLDGMLVRDVWSKTDGAYEFKGIAIQEYYVIAYDHTGTYNAVIKDSITPDTYVP